MGLHDATAVLVLESNLAFEAQHLMHALTRNNVRKWVALSEGAGGSVGWLTVCCAPSHSAILLHLLTGDISLFVRPQTNERKEVRMHIKSFLYNT